jgi:3-oxoadipate enol-lactonase
MPSIQVNGTTLHVEIDGPEDAPALVLSHSLFFDHRMYDAQVAALAGTHRVVRYDHRGQGASTRAPRAELDMDTLTDDAAGLIEALGLGPVTFYGNSMGGFVALRLAARRPDLVSGVVVACSSAAVEGAIAEFDPLVVALGEHGVAPVIDVVAHIMLGDTTLTDPDRADLLASTRAHFATLESDIADAAWQVVHRTAVTDELPGVAVPTLVIAGVEDHAYSVALSEEIARLVPGAELRIVEGAGHSVACEQPEQVNALLADFAARTAGVPG